MTASAGRVGPWLSRPWPRWPRWPRTLGLLCAAAALAAGACPVPPALPVPPELPAAPVAAENTVTLTVTGGGEVTAFVARETLGPLAAPAPGAPGAPGGSRWQTGHLRLVVSDPRGTSAGWRVSIVAGDFTVAGDGTARGRIDSSGLWLLVAPVPAVAAGQARGAGGPNAMPRFGVSLDSPRVTMQAAPGAGSGTYTQDLAVGLEIPAGTPGGAYEAVLEIAIGSGP